MLASNKAYQANANNEASCNSTFEVIKSISTETSNVGTGLAFRGWNYAHILIRLLIDAIDQEISIHTGGGVTPADRPWFLAQLSQVEIRRMASPLRVKGLGSAMHDTDEYVLIPTYTPAVKDGVDILCRVFREIHLVDNLKAHMLLGNDIIGPEKIVLDISQGTAQIGSCGITANMTSRQRRPYQKRVIHAHKALTVAPRANIMVSVTTSKALPDRDYIFEPLQQHNLTLFAHLVDSHISSILVKNETDQTVHIPKRHRLGMLCEIDYGNVFFAEATTVTETLLKATEDALPEATMKSSIDRSTRHSKASKPTTNWIKKATTLAAVATVSIASSLSQLVYNATTTAHPITDIATETTLL